MSKFVYPVCLPSVGRTAYFSEFTNSHHKSFCKTILTDDIYSFNKFVDDLIVELCPQININNLNIADKFYSMLSIRANNIGPMVEYTVDVEDEQNKKENVQFSINLIDLLNKFDYYDIYSGTKIEEYGFEIYASLPKQFSNSIDIYDNMYNSIDKVVFKDKDIDINKLTKPERQQLLDKLPGTLLGKIVNFLKRKEDILVKEPFVNIDIQKQLPFDTKMHLSMFNNSFYELLKMFFNVNLKDFYSYEYTLIKNFNFSYDQINKITPGELQTYFNVISEQLAKEKQEREESEQGNQWENPGPPNNMPHY